MLATLKYPADTKMHVLDLGTLRADEGWNANIMQAT